MIARGGDDRDFAEAFGSRQALCDLRADGHDDARLVGGRRACNARHHAALTDEFESANVGTWNVERVNGLIYAVVMESRGVYMSTDMATSKVYADGILKFNAQIAKVVEHWKKSVRCDDAELFEQFSKRIAQFIDFRRELARLGTEVSPAAGRDWGDNDANRSVRKALNCRSRQAHGSFMKNARKPRLYRDRRRHRRNGDLASSIFAALRRYARRPPAC